MTTTSYLPYHEPSLTELLISSTFLLALNGINAIFDRTLACGLVGQVLIGTAWGYPGARWLSIGTQSAVSSLGYLGLILIVHAGGAETNVVALRKNLILSVAVAATGVAVPIALSFALLASDGMFLGKGEPVTPLQAFAAGAALCSTSLGTMFSMLQSSGLSRTRLGAVLASAALLDDVVGLVMVRIITSLGTTGGSSVEPAILRSVLVSIAFAAVVLLACNYALKPVQNTFDRIVNRWGGKQKESGKRGGGKKTRLLLWIRSQEAGFIFQTALLILLVVAADYAGASILLAAYLAGVVVSWWDGLRDVSKAPRQPQPVEAHPAEATTSPMRQSQSSSLRESRPTDGSSPPQASNQEVSDTQHTTSQVFETYYTQVVNRVLKPFFFASIGFSIPISQLFAGNIAWRGIVYIILMTIGKLACGLWLVRFPISILGPLRNIVLIPASKYRRLVWKIRSRSSRSIKMARVAPEAQSNENRPTQTISTEPGTPETSPPQQRPAETTPSPPASVAPKPLSLYPAAVMGCAMVARGEIGFLIASTAEGEGVFRRPDEDPSKASELFLIVTWAIFFCTIIGPLCAGLLVRRIKKLEKASEASRDGSRNVLGVWGVG
ncbi:Sodium/hydrogen exchanger [Xylaria intraflava]|nr:Sodium/hydrogen exchanger [Xylaria intraflava]